MNSDYQHTVLVVGNDEPANKLIHRFLEAKTIACTFADSEPSAREKINKAVKPFSLILSDQNLSGMKGTEFLDQVKIITPESIRFLMTSSSETKTIMNAVNKGSIQRYIVKPWEKKDFDKAITSGIQLYESFLDNQRLIALAKKQNTTLYNLTSELMATTKSHNKTIHALDDDIERCEKQIKILSSQKPTDTTVLLNEIENTLKDGSGMTPEKANTLFSKTIKGLYDQFTELARRKGFEMPSVKAKPGDDAEDPAEGVAK